MSADVMATHKRYREEAIVLDSWIPGAGVERSFEAKEEQTKHERLFKTSMLFLQLEVFTTIDFFCSMIEIETSLYALELDGRL